MNAAQTPLTPVAMLSMLIVLVMATLVVVLTNVVDSQPPVSRHVAPMMASKQAIAEDELTLRFQQAVVMLHAGQFEHAITALHRVIELDPRLPEAHVNMGYALLGLERYKAAHDFFMQATNLNPYQGNAYWGLSVAYERLENLPAALGAMRTFIHLAKPDDPYLRRARSALWEWEYQLERGPLPDKEKEFLQRGAEQWQQRNRPQRDQPHQEQIDIEVKSILD